MNIIEIEGQALQHLLRRLDVMKAEHRDVYKISVTNDGGVKLKVNEGMWSPPYPTAEDIRREEEARAMMAAQTVWSSDPESPHYGSDSDSGAPQYGDGA